MYIKSVCIQNGMVTIVVADSGDISKSESFCLSLSNFRKFSGAKKSGDGELDTESVLGLELDEARYDELYNLNEMTTAVLDAARIMTAGERSRSELKNKLRRKFSDGASAYAVDLMEKRGYLNEEKSCANLAEYAVERKHYGAYRIRTELAAKGYGNDAIAHAIASIDQEKFDAALGYWIEKKLSGTDEVTKDEVKKAAVSIVRYGFSADAVIRGIRKFINK